MTELEVLIVDDDPDFARGLSRFLVYQGCAVRTASSVAAAKAQMASGRVHIAFVDFELPDGTAPEMVTWLAARREADRIFCVTGNARCANVVAAMRAGVADVLEKPIEPRRLTSILNEVRELVDPDHLSQWRAQVAPDLVGDSPAMREVLRAVKTIAQTTSTVLLTGESGTGKEEIAHAIHNASRRRGQPFVAVNCAAIPETLIEAELFGNVRGAFTGATGPRDGFIPAAHGGTLFLDEIGDMPLAAQAKLLRVLQTQTVTPVGSTKAIPVDIRVIAATHQDLEALVDAGRFREDLYYRLHVIPLALPPLRERAEDIVPLARFFAARSARRMGLDGVRLDASAEGCLLAHRWPGNVRELANAMERAVVLSGGGVITASHVQIGRQRRSGSKTMAAVVAHAEPVSAPMPVQPAAPASTPAPVVPLPARASLDLKQALDQVERELIQRALAESGGNRTEAAALLGVNRSTLVEKLRRIG
jgi:DNA-binding NtrC family response regulator